MRIFYIILSTLFIISCRTNSEERTLKGNEYFPMRVGDIRMYAIDTIVYDLFNRQIDTFSNIVREEVVEKYLDASNDSVFRIELSTYNDQKVDWVVFKTFERKIKDNYALEKMENSTEVKMLFPIASYKTKGSSYSWNTNMFNGKEPVIIKYTSVFTPFHNGIGPYNDCVSVKLNKADSGVINKRREEIYAKNIGLIYRFTDSTDNLLDPDFPSGKKTLIRLMN